MFKIIPPFILFFSVLLLSGCTKEVITSSQAEEYAIERLSKVDSTLFRNGIAADYTIIATDAHIDMVDDVINTEIRGKLTTSIEGKVFDTLITYSFVSTPVLDNNRVLLRNVRAKSVMLPKIHPLYREDFRIAIYESLKNILPVNLENEVILSVRPSSDKLYLSLVNNSIVLKSI